MTFVADHRAPQREPVQQPMTKAFREYEANDCEASDHGHFSGRSIGGTTGSINTDDSADTNKRNFRRRRSKRYDQNDKSEKAEVKFSDPPLKYVYIQYSAPPCTDLKFCNCQYDRQTNLDDEEITIFDSEESNGMEEEGPHLLSWENNDNVYEDYLNHEDDATSILSIPNDPYLSPNLQRAHSSSHLKAAHSPMRRHNSSRRHRPYVPYQEINRLTWSYPGDSAAPFAGIASTMETVNNSTSISTPKKSHRKHSSGICTRQGVIASTSPKSIFEVFDLPDPSYKKSQICSSGSDLGCCTGIEKNTYPEFFEEVACSFDNT